MASWPEHMGGSPLREEGLHHMPSMRSPQLEHASTFGSHTNPTAHHDKCGVGHLLAATSGVAGKKFNSMLVCVDRLSGWVIARPTTKLGLTAEKAAHLVMDDGWDVFGIPAVITSDQGPQFVGQWWRTMCAHLGIWQAWSQAYRPQANGRETLMGFMRRLWVESGINWVEALPRVLRVYHDTRGESGYSPFQIVFGRDRFVAGAPLLIERECVGASDFMDRMEWLDAEVSKKLEDLLESEVSRAYSARRLPPTYQPGD